MSSGTRTIDVQEVSPPRTEMLPFAIALPPDLSFVPTDPDCSTIVRNKKPLPAATASFTGGGQHQSKGIVGTITMLGDKSVMIWFGWGDVNPVAQSTTGQQSDQSLQTAPTVKSIGTAPKLTMGPLVVGMPRMKYKGAFSEEQQASVSKLIGSSSSDDVGDGGIQNTRIASQLADRLSQRLQMAIYCSCSLEGSNMPLIPGSDDGVMEQQMLRSRAGALAEKEIGRILEEKLLGKAEKSYSNEEAL